MSIQKVERFANEIHIKWPNDTRVISVEDWRAIVPIGNRLADEIEAEKGKKYRCYLCDCKCESPGVIIYEGLPVCRWCRKPYAKTGRIAYLDSHFLHIEAENEIEKKEDEYYVRLHPPPNPTEYQMKIHRWRCACGREFDPFDIEDCRSLAAVEKLGELLEPGMKLKLKCFFVDANSSRKRYSIEVNDKIVFYGDSISAAINAMEGK